MKTYINDFSIICAQGSSNDEIKKSLFQKKSFKEPSVFHLVDSKTCPVFKVEKDFSLMPDEFKSYDSRNNRMLRDAVQKIKPKVLELAQKFGKNRVAIVLGTSTSGIEEGFRALKEKSTDYNYYLQEIGSPSDFLTSYLGLKGISYTISTACSSGARAFIEGQNLLRNNLCDAVIVGGCDTLSELTLNGFHSLEAVDQKITNPMSKNRQGINIGEGAALFILSKDQSKYFLAGVGESSDAFHISSPEPNGIGAKRAMLDALKDAKLSVSDIDYINLHGTGTIKNDEMESRVIHELFCEDVYVSSTKPLTGHTLGAAGAIELGLCLLSLDENALPIHHFDGEVDTFLPKIKLVRDEVKTKVNYAMSNSYAFGGNNVSLIVGINNDE